MPGEPPLCPGWTRTRPATKSFLFQVNLYNIRCENRVQLSDTSFPGFFIIKFFQTLISESSLFAFMNLISAFAKIPWVSKTAKKESEEVFALTNFLRISAMLQNRQQT